MRRPALPTDNPFMKPTNLTVINPQPRENGWQIVVLERIEPGVTPDYCVHGKTTCHKCQDWCWLGANTYAEVVKGDTLPMCIECATEVGVHLHGVPVRNLRDGDAHG
jgi:hypothetical protein